MFCKKCGAEIMDEAVICVKCGTPTNNYANVQQAAGTPSADANAPANVVLVILSVLFPIVGFIMGAVNLSNGKKRSGKAYLIAGGVAFLISFCISMFTFI